MRRLQVLEKYTVHKARRIDFLRGKATSLIAYGVISQIHTSLARESRIYLMSSD
jgi:hypothetical protein